MRISFVPVMRCEKMAVTDMFRQRAGIDLLVEKGNSAGVTTSDFVACMEMSAGCQQCEKVGETF
jgi:hypothetical protein